MHHWRYLFAYVFNRFHIFLWFFHVNNPFECIIVTVDEITFRKWMLILLLQKTVNRKNTSYEIKDGSGSIEVVGSGKWHNINCKEGDKLHLFCFHLKTIDRQPKLVCGDHSFVKVGCRQQMDFPKRNLTFALRFWTWSV